VGCFFCSGRGRHTTSDVAGVQTCALPIYLLERRVEPGLRIPADYHGDWDSQTGFNAPLHQVSPGDLSVDQTVQDYLAAGLPAGRSEERRVGKGSGASWPATH